MKIAFDVHGTITAFPDKFRLLIQEAANCGHQVYIISGPPIKKIRKRLRRHNIKGYHHIISVVDWIKDQGIKMKQHPDGSFYTDESTWWSSKGLICYQESIDMIYDDSLKYKGNMPETTLFLHVE